MKTEYTPKQISAMKICLEKWGLSEQVDQTTEECAELIVALHKAVKRTPKPGAREAVLDELCDVEMMIAQMRIAFEISDEEFAGHMGSKFEKLQRYLDRK